LQVVLAEGSFTNVAAENLSPMEYWKAVLPETPMPPAIHGLFTKSEGVYFFVSSGLHWFEI